MTTAQCRHCGRDITFTEDGEYGWIDPEATGDDSIWRETCDSHDTFIANHEPIDLAAAFADAVEVDHLTDEQVEQVAAVFDNAEAREG